MDNLVEFLKWLNPTSMIGIGLIMWYFSGHIEQKIDSLSKKNDDRFIEQGKRIDRLYEMFVELVKNKTP